MTKARILPPLRRKRYREMPTDLAPSSWTQTNELLNRRLIWLQRFVVGVSCLVACRRRPAG